MDHSPGTHSYLWKQVCDFRMAIALHGDMNSDYFFYIKLFFFKKSQSLRLSYSCLQLWDQKVLTFDLHCPCRLEF